MGKSGKRANGEGSISKKQDGRYEAALTVVALEGKKRLRTTKRTRVEADRWLTEMKSRSLLGSGFDAEKLSFGDYLARWLADGVEGDVKESTWIVHRRHVEKHISPALGGVRLARLTAAHFQSFYREKLTSGLSERTVLGIHATARKALAQAVRWDLVHKNAAANAKPPRPKKEKIESLSRGQARRLIAACENHRLRGMYILALAAGMRHGELLALRWDDIVFRDGGATDTLSGAEIAVQRTVTRNRAKREGGAGVAVGTPKTGKTRVVSVGRNVAAALKERRRIQKEERIAFGSGYADSGYVFTLKKGGIINPRTSQVMWEGVRAEAGLPNAKFHHLRHTAATLALVDGVHVKIVSEMLGHTSVQITLDVYAHVSPNMQRDAADVMDAGLF